MTIDEQLTSPAFFAEGDFRGLFKRLRRDDPVHWTSSASGPGFWSLFRHADVSRVLDDPAKRMPVRLIKRRAASPAWRRVREDTGGAPVAN